MDEGTTVQVKASAKGDIRPFIGLVGTITGVEVGDRFRPSYAEVKFVGHEHVASRWIETKHLKQLKEVAV